MPFKIEREGEQWIVIKLLPGGGEKIVARDRERSDLEAFVRIAKQRAGEI